MKTGPFGCGLESEALERARAEPLYPPWTRAQWITAAVVAASVLLYPAVFTQPYMRHIMVMVFIYGLMAQGWNVLAGYCGQISLGHAASNISLLAPQADAQLIATPLLALVLLVFMYRQVSKNINTSLADSPLNVTVHRPEAARGDPDG